MLTGLKVSSFPCKCVFYRPEHNAKRNLILKVLKCKNEAHQQIEFKELMKQNGVICLVAMFTPGVTIIKMSKMAHFLYFLLMATKNQAQFGQKKSRASDRSHWADINPWKYVFERVSLLFANLAVFVISTLDISRAVTQSRSQTPKPYHFLRELKEIFQVHFFPKLTNFSCHQLKTQNNEPFLTF